MSFIAPLGRSTGVWYPHEPGVEDVRTLEDAVLHYARLLDIQAEFDHYSHAPSVCWLGAFGISPPTNEAMRLARDAVVAHMGDVAPSRGLAG